MIRGWSWIAGGSGSSGTVTSVGLALPAIFVVSGSPVTTSGTLTGTLATQLANLVWAGPASGGAATPTFRSLVVADLPTNIPNANLANSSIAFAAGTSGTDIAWASSPVSLGGTATLNVPSASTTARGVITTATQTLTGFKTLTNTYSGVSSTANDVGMLISVDYSNSSGNVFNQARRLTVLNNRSYAMTGAVTADNVQAQHNGPGTLNELQAQYLEISNNTSSKVTLGYAHSTIGIQFSSQGWGSFYCYNGYNFASDTDTTNVYFAYTNFLGGVTKYGLYVDVSGSINYIYNLHQAFAAEHRHYDASNANYGGFKAPSSISSNYMWNLPGADSQGSITSDGANTLSIVRTDDSTYTPTLTGVTNITSVSSNPASYFRRGSRVFVFGSSSADPTLTGTTKFRISLPIASGLAATTDLNGTGAWAAISGQSAGIYADTGNDEALIEWVAVDITNQTVFWSFSYTII